MPLAGRLLRASRTRVVETAGARLDALDLDQMAAALETVATTVRTKTEALDSDLLKRIAVSVADDFYKSLASISNWSDGADSYVRAVFGTFFDILTERGIPLRYVVENTYAQDLICPLQFFPDVFAAVGFIYDCPHLLALRLAQGDGRFPDGIPDAGDLAPWLAEGRDVASQLACKATDSQRHLMYLEVDFVEGALDEVLSLPGASGTIIIFRNEAPVMGSNVNVRYL